MIDSIEAEEIAFEAEYLSKVCKPKVVIDVGVAYGTKALYNAFGDARLILVEPLTEYEGYLNYYVKKHNAEVVYKALGSAPGEMDIQFHEHLPQKATFLERSYISSNKGEPTKRKVHITTLADIFKEKNITEGPIFLKLDCEGWELEVLKGGLAILNQIDFIIVETSIIKRFENSYDYEELVAFMYHNGFRVYSFLTMKHFNKEMRQRYTDILFIRKDLLIE